MSNRMFSTLIALWLLVLIADIGAKFLVEHQLLNLSRRLTVAEHACGITKEEDDHDEEENINKN